MTTIDLSHAIIGLQDSERKMKARCVPPRTSASESSPSVIDVRAEDCRLSGRSPSQSLRPVAREFIHPFANPSRAPRSHVRRRRGARCARRWKSSAGTIWEFGSFIYVSPAAAARGYPSVRRKQKPNLCRPLFLRPPFPRAR